MRQHAHGRLMRTSLCTSHADAAHAAMLVQWGDFVKPRAMHCRCASHPLPFALNFLTIDTKLAWCIDAACHLACRSQRNRAVAVPCKQQPDGLALQLLVVRKLV
jgi:hypothetical protein